MNIIFKPPKPYTHANWLICDHCHALLYEYWIEDDELLTISTYKVVTTCKHTRYNGLIGIDPINMRVVKAY